MDVRGILVSIVMVGLLIAVPTAYAQNWPPAVIVESSSMMHRDDEVSYGRVGTIDPGDLVLVKRVVSPDDIATFVEGEAGRYDAPGDVIVYYSANDRGSTPIIHRAMAYVDVVQTDDGTRYRVRWSEDRACEGGSFKDPANARWCIFPAEGIYLPAYGIRWDRTEPYQPNADGFITKGDNPVTNTQMDPGSISRDANGDPSVVRFEWIEGKARGELPWFGLVKLALAGKPNERSPPDSYVQIGSAYAPLDLWVSLFVALGLVLGGPFAYDTIKAIRARRAKV